MSITSRRTPSPRPLQLAFFLNAIGVSIWFPRIPDVKALLEVDLFTLSVCFFMLPVGTFAGFAIAPALLQRTGSRLVVAWGGAVFILSFVLPALAPSAFFLGLALFCCGLVVAPVEVALNSKTSAFETRHGRRVMARCHAFWSFGAMTGAVIGGTFAQAGISFLAQQMILAPGLAVIAVLAGRALEADDPRLPGPSGGIALPGRAIAALCLLPIGALMLEGSMMEWSALFLRDSVGIAPLGAAAVFAGFSVAMGTGRLTGDALATRFGDRRVLAMSSLLASAGMFAFANAAGFWPALVAATVLGLGTANIYPLSVSLVGRAASAAGAGGAGPERNIAALTLVGFTAFLIGPPLIGVLGSVFGLPAALALLTPMGLYPLVILARSPALSRRGA